MPAMTESNTGPDTEQATPPDETVRAAQDLLFFAYRDFTNAADVILAELGLGRAHHRAMHFILRITKQSLARVLSDLMDRGYVAQAPGRADRRQRLLSLTQSGAVLERRLYASQKARLGPAFQAAGEQAVAGFNSVLRGIMDDTARAYIDNNAPANRRP
jgi:DNA-binding MarR family transcriptional regulator